MGIEALKEAADLVVAGRAQATVQDESQASYEGWCRDAEAQINWHNHIDQVYNLIRGCNPAPAAWTLLHGKKLRVLEARKHLVRTFGQVKGKIGAVTDIGEKSLLVSVQGGQIEVFTLRWEDGKETFAAPEFLQAVSASPPARSSARDAMLFRGMCGRVAGTQKPVEKLASPAASYVARRIEAAPVTLDPPRPSAAPPSPDKTTSTGSHRAFRY